MKKRNLQSLTLKKLQKLCEENGLSKKGNKKNIVDRLREYYDGEITMDSVSDTDNDDATVRRIQFADNQERMNTRQSAITSTPLHQNDQNKTIINNHSTSSSHIPSEHDSYIQQQQPHQIHTTMNTTNVSTPIVYNSANILPATYTQAQLTNIPHHTAPTYINTQPQSLYTAPNFVAYTPLPINTIHQNQYQQQPVCSTIPFSQAAPVSTNIPMYIPSIPMMNTPSYIDNRMHNSYGNIRDIIEILPEFHPFDTNSLKVDQFIERINQLKLAYGWDDKAVLFAVYTKLKGPAKLWIDNSNVFHTWKDFTTSFLKDFPCEFNIADIHLELAESKQKQYETMESFYYRILSTGRRGNLPDKAIIKYILRGIRDKEFVRSASTFAYEHCTDLLTAIKRYSNLNTQRLAETRTFMKSSNQNAINPVHQNSQIVKSKTDQILCYNCFKTGHVAIHCPQPSRRERCTVCLRTNHKTADCKQKRTTTETQKSNVNKIIVKTEEKPVKDKITKIVKIGNREYEAFIDPGSSYTLIKNSLTTDIGLTKSVDINLMGFGGGSYH